MILPVPDAMPLSMVGYGLARSGLFAADIGALVLVQQHAAILGPAHVRDAGRFALEPRELELLATDHVLLRTHFIGQAPVFQQQPAMREHLDDCSLEIRIGPRLADEAKDPRMVNSAHDAVDIGACAHDDARRLPPSGRVRRARRSRRGR